MSITWTGGTGTGVTYTYTIYRSTTLLALTTDYTVSGTASPVTITFTNNAQNSYTFAVTATAGANSLTSATSVAVNTPSAIPTPDILWFKFDNTTWNGTDLGTGAFKNAATTGTAYSGSYWWGNGTVTYNSNFNGAKCFRFAQSASPSNKFLFTTNAITMPSSVAGNAYTICFWLYVPSFSGCTYSRAFSLANISEQKNDGTGSEAGQDFPSMYFNSLGQLAIQSNNGTSYGGYTQPTGVWTHYAFKSVCTVTGASTGTNGQANTATSAFYINGTAQYSGSSYTNSWLTQGSGGFNVAMANYSINFYMADLRIYGSALTNTQVSTIYGLGTPV